MAYEHKLNTGSLFRNEKKTSDKAPDYKGEMNLDGNVIKLAGWITTTKAGQTYLKIQKDDYTPSNAATAAPAATDDLPF